MNLGVLKDGCGHILGYHSKTSASNACAKYNLYKCRTTTAL